MKTIRFAALAALAIMMAVPAQASWRVVGPGMAVAEARSGKATIAAECLHDGLVLGLYNLNWDFDHGEELDLIVDGETFVLRQYISGDRIVFSDRNTATGNLDISPELREALKRAGAVHLEGSAIGHIEPAAVTFSMNRSRYAIEAVEQSCQ